MTGSANPTGPWRDHRPALSAVRKNLPHCALLLDRWHHGGGRAWFASHTPWLHSEYRRLRGNWPDTLGNLRCHPVVDLFGGWRSNQSEHIKTLRMILFFLFENSKLRYFPVGDTHAANKC